LARKFEKRKYGDRREYLIEAVRKRRKKIRQMAIEYKGGKCEMCSYSRCIEALEFHHVNSSGKDFSISDKGYTRSWNKVKEELDKCVLLCANCHREIHAKLAASSGNAGMKKRVNSGNPRRNVGAILSQAPIYIGEGAETRHSLPKAQHNVGQW
jgi:hypothetical protein